MPSDREPAFPGYSSTKPVSSGPWSEAYTAVNARGKRVFIKTPRLPLTPHARSQFANEQGVLAGLGPDKRTDTRSKHVVSYIDDGLLADRPFYVMELVEGVSLRSLLRRGKMDWREVCRVGAEVARGVAWFQTATGRIHYDLKPENLMVRPDGTVVIVDFGLCHVPETGRRNAAPRRREYGSPPYADLDPRSGYKADVFSLGVILYEMLTRPFTRADADVFKHSAFQTPPRWAEQLGIPSDLVMLIASCLGPAEYRKPAGEVAEDLEVFRTLGESVIETVKMDPSVPAMNPQETHSTRRPAAYSSAKSAAVGAIASAAVTVLLLFAGRNLFFKPAGPGPVETPARGEQQVHADASGTRREISPKQEVTSPTLVTQAPPPREKTDTPPIPEEVPPPPLPDRDQAVAKGMPKEPEPGALVKEKKDEKVDPDPDPPQPKPRPTAAEFAQAVKDAKLNFVGNPVRVPQAVIDALAEIDPEAINPATLKGHGDRGPNEYAGVSPNDTQLKFYAFMGGKTGYYKTVGGYALFVNTLGISGIGFPNKPEYNWVGKPRYVVFFPADAGQPTILRPADVPEGKKLTGHQVQDDYSRLGTYAVPLK